MLDEITKQSRIERLLEALAVLNLTADDFALAIILDAEAHGADSDPDHEIGDLHDALHACAKRLHMAQRLDILVELKRGRGEV